VVVELSIKWKLDEPSF